MMKGYYLLFCFLLLASSCASKRVAQNPEPQKQAVEETKPGQEFQPVTEESAAQQETAPEAVLPEEEGAVQQEEEFAGEDLDYFDHEKEIQRALSQEGAGSATFDIPMVMNERVEWWMKHFQTDGAKFFRAWLERSEKYIPMMQKILRENGLPEDLVYLAMIESGFKPYAYSRARAVGPWQFIARTGKRYGLKANWCLDERRDPEKSTIAAAQHLKDLYDQFDHWYLAAAGYNAGAGKIKKAIEKYSTEDFWEMSKFRYLRRETKDYVPKMIAAAMIAKSPAKYGFTDIAYMEPLEYDKVVVSKPTDLKSIAEAIETDFETLKNLNPDLLRWFTPPDYPNYELKIPKGKTELYAQKESEFKVVSVSSTVQHRLRRGETLSHLAKSYNTSIDSILAFNTISDPRRLKAGQVLYVPVRAGTKPKVFAQATYTENKIDIETYKKAIKEDGAVGYTVRTGDTIWSISRSFNVTVQEIRKWNRLGSVRMIHPGDKLIIYPRFLNGTNGGNRSAPPQDQSSPTSKNARFHKVKNGETLWGISKSYNVPVTRLLSLNNIDRSKGIRAGDLIKLYN